MPPTTSPRIRHHHLHPPSCTCLLVFLFHFSYVKCFMDSQPLTVLHSHACRCHPYHGKDLGWAWVPFCRTCHRPGALLERVGDPTLS
jgi:hypothetical protein